MVEAKYHSILPYFPDFAKLKRIHTFYELDFAFLDFALFRKRKHLTF